MELDIKTISNLLRMGHCAPTVMLTAQQTIGLKDDRLVKITSGMPGGIGNLRSECGSVTSPIMNIFLKHGETFKSIVLGKTYLERFRYANGAILCREILKNERNPLPCIRAVCSAHRLLKKILKEGISDINGSSISIYTDILKLFKDKRFHCAHSVLFQLDDLIEIDKILIGATWGFIGGTLLQGMTCGALTAGVLTIGSVLGEIENSCFRVLKMVGLMITGGDAMSEDINKFNKAINTSNRLALQFIDIFGSSNCKDIINTDFYFNEDVHNYIKEEKIDHCREISNWVARTVREILVEANEKS